MRATRLYVTPRISGPWAPQQAGMHESRNVLLTFHELVLNDVAQFVRQVSLLVVWNAWSGLKEVKSGQVTDCR